MKPKTFYVNKLTPNVAIYVNYLMGKDSGGLRVNVDWYTKQGHGKLVKMDSKQEYFLTEQALTQWVMMK